MSIDFTPGIINTYHGDIYNCTTNTDNVKTPDTPKWPCDNWEEQQPINSIFSGEGYNPEQFDLAQQQLQQIKEGANKQVISSQADSLIKISRSWADFFPANTSNQPV
ncbi:hypothetical protein OFS24_26350, partial [Escherichia coli]|nr:hypothetical protein [Escherichia coli]